MIHLHYLSLLNSHLPQWVPLKGIFIIQTSPYSHDDTKYIGIVNIVIPVSVDKHQPVILYQQSTEAETKIYSLHKQAMHNNVPGIWWIL